jgi:hypothetical protein
MYASVASRAFKIWCTAEWCRVDESATATQSRQSTLQHLSRELGFITCNQKYSVEKNSFVVRFRKGMADGLKLAVLGCMPFFRSLNTANSLGPLVDRLGMHNLMIRPVLALQGEVCEIIIARCMAKQ